MAKLHNIDIGWRIAVFVTLAVLWVNSIWVLLSGIVIPITPFSITSHVLWVIFLTLPLVLGLKRKKPMTRIMKLYTIVIISFTFLMVITNLIVQTTYERLAIEGQTIARVAKIATDDQYRSHVNDLMKHYENGNGLAGMLLAMVAAENTDWEENDRIVSYAYSNLPILESNKLLEHFQWSLSEEAHKTREDAGEAPVKTFMDKDQINNIYQCIENVRNRYVSTFGSMLLLYDQIYGTKTCVDLQTS